MGYSDDFQVRPSPTLKTAQALRENPIDVFVRLATAEHYETERVAINELHLSMAGVWCDHDISLIWHPGKERLDLYLLFDGRAPGGRSSDICRLLSLLNERLTSGHFDFWEKDRALVYRNAISLAGGAKLTLEQAMCLLANALDAAERGYPASQYVLWAGKTPEEAIDTVLLELASTGVE